MQSEPTSANNSPDLRIPQGHPLGSQCSEFPGDTSGLGYRSEHIVTPVMLADRYSPCTIPQASAPTPTMDAMFGSRAETPTPANLCQGVLQFESGPAQSLCPLQQTAYYFGAFDPQVGACVGVCAHAEASESTSPAPYDQVFRGQGAFVEELSLPTRGQMPPAAHHHQDHGYGQRPGLSGAGCDYFYDGTASAASRPYHFVQIECYGMPIRSGAAGSHCGGTADDPAEISSAPKKYTFEVAVPCGFGYLPDPDTLAQAPQGGEPRPQDDPDVIPCAAGCMPTHSDYGGSAFRPIDGVAQDAYSPFRYPHSPAEIQSSAQESTYGAEEASQPYEQPQRSEASAPQPIARRRGPARRAPRDGPASPMHNRKRKAPQWTVCEDQQLVASLRELSGRNWKRVAASLNAQFPNNRRTSDQCSQRYWRCIAPTKKGPWTPEEDEALIHAALVCPPRNWKMIASMVPGRCDIQCRYRLRRLAPRLLKKGILPPSHMP